jgi:hypothetical protein
LQTKEALTSRMRAGVFVVQTPTRALANQELTASRSDTGSQLLRLLLASRRQHWNSSLFLIVFSRARAASDGSTALIAVNITQQLDLRECPLAFELHRISGVPCSLYRGGPCRSNSLIAVVSVEAPFDWKMLFQHAKAFYHPNLVHIWESVKPPRCFFRYIAFPVCTVCACSHSFPWQWRVL